MYSKARRHELRNPLAPILDAALLLRLQSNRNRLRGIENPILQQAATIIERQVGQLTRIVDELLEVSRITTGRIQLRQESIALGVVVENAVATVRSLFDQERHELTVSLPAQAIWVHADEARLGLLTPAEQQLARSRSDKGRDLLKQVQTYLIETAKPLIQAMVQEITGVSVVSLHHDISTLTGEAFVVLTLAEPTSFRQSHKTQR